MENTLIMFLGIILYSKLFKNKNTSEYWYLVLLLCFIIGLISKIMAVWLICFVGEFIKKNFT